MSNKLLLSIVCLALIVSSKTSANGFNGFYVGGFVGTEARGTQYNDQKTNVNNQYNKNKVGGLLGAHAGYGYVINSFYIGGEISLYGTTSQGSFRLVDQTSKTEKLVKYKRGLVVSLAPHVGHIFDENNVVYARFGIEYSKDNATFCESNGTSLARISKGVFAFAPGFAFVHKFNDCLRGGIEYSYSIGKTVSNKFAQDATQTFRAKRSSHQVMFRISYTF